MSDGYIDLREVRQPDHDHELSPNAQQRTDEESNAIHESEVEQQLRQRIRELEGIVTSQNAELQEMEVIKRNKSAVLEKLVRVQAEKVAIEENRESLFEDLEFQKEQAVRYTKEIDGYKDKLEYLNTHILKICNDAKEKVIRSLTFYLIHCHYIEILNLFTFV
jgi:chromosome segregation ATPase